MSGSDHPDINRIVAMWNTGQQPAAIASARSPGMTDAIRTEISRLAAPGRRALLAVDEVSRRQHAALIAILSATAQPS